MEPGHLGKPEKELKLKPLPGSWFGLWPWLWLAESKILGIVGTNMLPELG